MKYDYQGYSQLLINMFATRVKLYSRNHSSYNNNYSFTELLRKLNNTPAFFNLHIILYLILLNNIKHINFQQYYIYNRLICVSSMELNLKIITNFSKIAFVYSQLHISEI